jgi:hypothetical protein
MRELAVVYISWLHLWLGDKGSHGNYSPYLVATFAEASLQSSIFPSLEEIMVTLCSELKHQKDDGQSGP